MLVRSRWASPQSTAELKIGLKQAVNMARNMQWSVLGNAFLRRQPVFPAAQSRLTLKTENSCARQDLRNRFEGLQLDEDTSPVAEMREFKDVVASDSQASLGRTRRRRRDWVTAETVALAKQARLAGVQSALTPRNLRMQATRAPHIVVMCDYLGL